MFIHREIGLKKTTDQNKLPIQCFSSCWQTRKESKHSFTLPVLNMRNPQNGAVAATNLAKHCDPAPPAAGSVQGGAAEQLQAPGLGRWANPSSRPTALPSAISPWTSSHSHCSSLAGWFYNLAFAVSLLCPSLLWLPAWLQSAPHCHSHRMVPVSWSCTETVQGCNKPEGLRISAKTVGISNNTMQLTSNLLHSVFTQFHHSVANSKELKSSTGWKGIDAPLNPVLLWVMEHSQQHLPDFLIHFILQDSFLKRVNVTLL